MKVINTKELLFTLVKSAVMGVAPDKSLTECIYNNADEMFALAVEHDVAHLASEALFKGKFELPESLRADCRQASFMSLIRYQQQVQEYKKLSDLFEDGNIPYIPLKGLILRDYYPEPWLRTSCDLDILIRQEDLKNATELLVNKLGYQVVSRCTHDVGFESPSGVHIELHFKLIDDDVKKAGEYLRKWNIDILKDVWKCAVLAEGTKCRYDMGNELFYLYHIAHMTKHFETGGCGIRPFIDLWVLNSKVAYDKNKLQKLLLDSNLVVFDSVLRKMTDVWFDAKEHDSLTLLVEDYILKGGVYGTLGNSVKFNQGKVGGKVKYILSRIFVSKDILRVYYPSVDKLPFLMPFYQLGRIVKIVRGKRLKQSVTEIAINNSLSNESETSMKQLIEKIGL